MMNELQIVQNVGAYIDDRHVARINAEDTERGLGFTTEHNGIQYVRWTTVNRYLKSFGFSQQVEKANDFMTEGLFYRLAMRANSETAMRFQGLVANEILPTDIFVIVDFPQFWGKMISSRKFYHLLQPESEAERFTGLPFLEGKSGGTAIAA